MSKRIDISGEKFGRWSVMSPSGRDSRGEVVWKCKCDCGVLAFITGSSLRTGNSKSCGCFMGELYRGINSPMATHHMSNSKIYNVWRGMLNRCENSNQTSYKYYGAKGIQVCESWHKFETFVLDMGIPINGLTIERIDNKGDYEPSNCKWATYREQQNNRRSNHRVSAFGKNKTIAEWSRLSYIPYATLYARICKLHWSVEKALTVAGRGIELI